jgi:poly-gamma-glutamate capsule biosynthesis protein CapA/YwtB (metallophosphatase superfamily)
MKRRLFFRGALILALLVSNGCQHNAMVTITFGGDVILGREGTALFGENDPWGEAKIFLDKLQKRNTIFMVNLESSMILDNTYINATSGYNLCAPAELVATLNRGGVDLASAINNHSQDCGEVGAAETRNILTDAGIQPVESAYEPVYFEQQGEQFAVIAADDVTDSVDLEALTRAIQTARDRDAFVIVSMHWGNEYHAGVDQRQLQLAQVLADAGTDILWGHHPHVLQKMDWVQSTADAHRMLVMYSLGNLLSDQGMTDDVRETALVSVSIRGGKITGISIQPWVMDMREKGLRFATSDEQQKIIMRLDADSLQDVKVVFP